AVKLYGIDRGGKVALMGVHEKSCFGLPPFKPGSAGSNRLGSPTPEYLFLRLGFLLLPLAIIAGLFAIAAQLCLAPAPTRGFGAIEEHALALVRCAHFKPGECAVRRAVI